MTAPRRWSWPASASPPSGASGRLDACSPGPAWAWSRPTWASARRPRRERRWNGPGLKLEDMDLVEVNEAFAAQYLAVEKELGLDRERTNVDGGAIALGHPLGASGARITLHLLHALRRRGGRYGLGSACIGGGQGAAVIVEAFQGEAETMDFLIPAAVVVVLYAFLSLRVLRQYERGVTFFLGKFWGTKGPGLIFLPAGLLQPEAGLAPHRRVGYPAPGCDHPG